MFFIIKFVFQVAHIKADVDRIFLIFPDVFFQGLFHRTMFLRGFVLAIFKTSIMELFAEMSMVSSR